MIRKAVIHIGTPEAAEELRQVICRRVSGSVWDTKFNRGAAITSNGAGGLWVAYNNSSDSFHVLFCEQNYPNVSWHSYVPDTLENVYGPGEYEDAINYLLTGVHTGKRVTRKFLGRRVKELQLP